MATRNVGSKKDALYILLQVRWGLDGGSKVYRPFSIVYSIQTILLIALNGNRKGWLHTGNSKERGGHD